MTASRLVFLIWTITCLALSSLAQAAAPKAWIDRDQVGLGETVTLNIEVEAADGEPDFTPLRQHFEILGRSSSTQLRIANGQRSQSTLWAVALEPTVTGRLEIPALTVGSQKTEPLTLTVTAIAQGAAAAGQPVFLEAELGPDAPYVGQMVIYTLRLYYAVQLLDGGLDADAPDGIDLRQLGADVSYRVKRAGLDYNVVERRYALLPERSGTVVLPPARFRGRALGDGRSFSWIGGGTVSALGPSLSFQARPRPPAAVEPWLPATSLMLALEPQQGSARVGEPFTVSQVLRAEGLVPEQWSDPPIREIDGAQVYAEPAEFSQSQREGRPVLEWRRKLAVLPLIEGELSVPALTVGWWDVLADAPRTATASALTIEVAPASPLASLGDAGTPARQNDAPPAGPVPAAPGLWPWLSAALALGWALTALWFWRQRAPAPTSGARGKPSSPSPSPRMLDRALASGDLSEAAAQLLALAPPPRPAGLSELAERLAVLEQRQAVLALQAALWGGGDAGAARASMRSAFTRPPVFAATGNDIEAAPDPLPPLYPPPGRA